MKSRKRRAHSTKTVLWVIDVRWKAYPPFSVYSSVGVLYGAGGGLVPRRWVETHTGSERVICFRVPCLKLGLTPNFLRITELADFTLCGFIMPLNSVITFASNEVLLCLRTVSKA